MKQEPVAWLSERLNDGSKRLSFYEPPNTDGNPDYKVEPLYTSPQYLTDIEICEEIEFMFGDINDDEFFKDLTEFAKQIIRKAKK